MLNKNNVKKEEIKKEEVFESQELDLNDLKDVTGGAGLRNAPKTKTTAISNDTKSKI